MPPSGTSRRRGEPRGGRRRLLHAERLGAPVSYLAGSARPAFDRWLASAIAHHSRDLEFREIRKGAQALSSLYVERRGGIDLAARSIEGRGKRAALATYYAPLHFLTAYHALFQIGVDRWGPIAEIQDLGCGSGAAGAAAALALGGAPRVRGIDRSGFMLAEARRGFSALGLSAQVRRGRLPAAAPRAVAGHLWLLGWAANEMGDRDRGDLLAVLTRALEGGVRLLVFEPLAGGATPWWPAWARALAAHGVLEGTSKVRVALPDWLARLDRAAGLDHRLLGARLLAGPLRAAASAA